MKLLTPAKGTLTLSATENPGLFRLAKVAVGALGVVTEVTLRTVPAHKLLEHTFVLSRQQVEDRHVELLQSNKHVRYMWVPYSVRSLPLRPARRATQGGRGSGGGGFLWWRCGPCARLRWSCASPRLAARGSWKQCLRLEIKPILPI